MRIRKHLYVIAALAPIALTSESAENNGSKIENGSGMHFDCVSKKCADGSAQENVAFEGAGRGRRL